jgi:hypothetical protein
MYGRLVQSSDLVGSTLIDSRTLVTDAIKTGARLIIAPLYNFCKPSGLLGELLSL